MKMFQFFGTTDKKVGDQFVYVNAETEEQAISRMLNGKPADDNTPVSTGKSWELSKDW